MTIRTFYGTLAIMFSIFAIVFLVKENKDIIDHICLWSMIILSNMYSIALTVLRKLEN